MTVTFTRTDEVTQQFIVMSWTLRPAVAYVVGMDTDSRVPATVETWTRHSAVTPRLVLTTYTVVHAVAPHVHGHAVVKCAGAEEVSFGARLRLVHSHLNGKTSAVEIDNDRRRNYILGGTHHMERFFADLLVTSIFTVCECVTQLLLTYTPTISALKSSTTLNIMDTEILV